MLLTATPRHRVRTTERFRRIAVLSRSRSMRGSAAAAVVIAVLTITGCGDSDNRGPSILATIPVCSICSSAVDIDAPKAPSYAPPGFPFSAFS